MLAGGPAQVADGGSPEARRRVDHCVIDVRDLYLCSRLLLGSDDPPTTRPKERIGRGRRQDTYDIESRSSGVPMGFEATRWLSVVRDQWWLEGFTRERN